MKTFSFGAYVGRHITHFESDFVISRLHRSETMHIACIRLAPGGSVGYHPAGTYQLFAVVDGDGWVRAEGDRVAIRAGEAAFWEPGEEHGAGTDTGMVAIIVESDALGAGEQGP